MCPLTGLLYVLMVPHLIKYYDNLLPPVGDGLLVGVGISGFIALSFFVMIGSLDGSVAGPLQPLLEAVHRNLPKVLLGGVLGGTGAGMASGLLLLNWQDL